jgi:DNA-binding transcriptional MerR regulator
MDFQTMADVQSAVKFYTKRGFNLTEQGKIHRQNPALHQRLKQEGAEIDRALDERVAQIDRRIAELQNERESLTGQRSPQSPKTTLRRW